NGEPSSKEESSDLSEVEPEISQFIQEKLAEELGWEFDEDDKFNSVKDVVAFLKEVVETNSQPQFANDELSKLNDFVANGGDIKDYIKVSKGEVDLESADLTNESNQKSV